MTSIAASLMLSKIEHWDEVRAQAENCIMDAMKRLGRLIHKVYQHDAAQHDAAEMWLNLMCKLLEHGEL